MTSLRSSLAMVLMLLASQATAGRLIWLHSGAPAKRLDVDYRADGRDVRVRSDAKGEVRAPADVSVRIVDWRSGLVLFTGALQDVTRVPEPIRIRGSVAGAESALTVRIGDGPRETPIGRWRRTYGMFVGPRSGEEALGLVLPDSPSRWQEARVARGANFSAWVVSWPPPQVLAFDADGGVAVKELDLVDAGPHRTIDIGAIVLRRAQGLDVRVIPPVPPGMLLILETADIANTDRDDAARLMSVLDQIDRRLFEVFVMRRPYGIGADGRSSWRWLPPVASLRIELAAPFDERQSTREVRFDASQRALIETTVDAALGITASPRGTVSGTVRLEREGAPVANAAVVLSDGIERRETTTDRSGAFAIPDVRVERPVSLFVDARRTAPLTHKPMAVFRRVEPKSGITLDLPRATALRPAGPAVVQGLPAGCTQIPEGVLGYPFVIGLLNGQPSSGFTVDPVFGPAESPQITVTVNTAGSWSFYCLATPFLELISAAPVVANANGVQLVVPLTPVNVIQPPFTLLFQYPRAGGGTVPASWMEVEFAPALLPGDPFAVQPARWLDAIPIVTNANGIIELPCVNTLPLLPLIWVPKTEYGCQDASLVPESGVTCVVNMRPDGVCTCEAPPQ